MKVLRTLGALLVLVSFLPVGAFAVGDCASMCSPFAGCDIRCFDENFGIVATCGFYGCCTEDQTHCLSLAATSSTPVTLSSTAQCRLASPLAAPQPTAGLPAFLAE